MINTMRVEEQFLYPLFFAFSPFTDVLTIAWHTYPAGTVGVFHDDSYIGYSYDALALRTRLMLVRGM